MTGWTQIKSAIRADLLSRDLVQPRRRLSALERVEELLVTCYPDFTTNPLQLLDVGKAGATAALGVLKDTGRLNGAESSVLNDLFAHLKRERLQSAIPGEIHGGSPESAQNHHGPEATNGGGIAESKRARTTPSVNRPGGAGNGHEVADGHKHGMAALVDESSRVLILGTMPGDESLRQQRYYANAGNQFWAILAAVYGEQIGHEYERRLEFLRDNGLALWDVLRSAERSGSLDSAICNEVPNDFAGFFGTYPQLRTIAFNGGKAESLYRKHVAKDLRASGIVLTSAVLPSTSPTPGRNVLRQEEKVVRWKQFLNP